MEEYINLDDVKNKLTRPYKVRKKPIVITAYQVPENFLVHSNEGIVEGKKDDWLMVGVNNEIYICNNEIFQKTYDILGAEK